MQPPSGTRAEPMGTRQEKSRLIFEQDRRDSIAVRVFLGPWSCAEAQRWVQEVTEICGGLEEETPVHGSTLVIPTNGPLAGAHAMGVITSTNGIFLKKLPGYSS